MYYVPELVLGIFSVLLSNHLKTIQFLRVNNDPILGVTKKRKEPRSKPESPCLFFPSVYPSATHWKRQSLIIKWKTRKDTHITESGSEESGAEQGVQPWERVPRGQRLGMSQ